MTYLDTAHPTTGCSLESRSTTTWRRWLGGAAASAAMLLALAAPIAQAQIGNSAGYATNGDFDGSILWLDFSGYDDAVAANGQAFSFNLPSGNRLSMTVTRTGSANVVNARAVPTWAGAAFGNGTYDGIPGLPVFYAAGVIDYTITLSNLVATDSAGNPRQLQMVVADGESTGIHEQEWLEFATNGSGWELVELISQPGTGGAPPSPLLTGLGTPTARWQGASDANYGSVLLRTRQPTTLTFSAGTRSGAEGFLVGVVMPRLELRKQFPDGLVNASDSVTLAAGYASPAVALGSVVTSGAGDATTGVMAAWPSGAITLGETGSSLSNYSSSLQCANNGGVKNPPTVMPGGPGTQFSLTPQFGDDIVCTLINARGVVPANVSLTKALTTETGSQPGIAEPAELLTYTITLTNSGGVAAAGYSVSDLLDVNTSFITASNGGTFAGGYVNWTGLTVPAGGSLLLTVQVQVRSPLPAGTAQVVNLAFPTGTTPPACPPAGPQCVITPTAALLSLDKAVVDAGGNGVADGGELLTYTITLTNSGGTGITGYTLIDQMDANTVFESASNGGTHAAGVVTWANLAIPANSTLALTLVARVVNPVPANVARISNYVRGSTDPVPNCAATPLPRNCAVIPAGVVPRVSISKAVDTANQANGSVVYTVIASNVGTVPAPGTLVSDPLATGLTAYAWTCSAANGAICPNASGSGALGETLATFPAGSSVTYLITATLATPRATVIANTASANPPGGLCAPGDLAPPCTTGTSFTPTQPTTPYQAPLPAPVDSRIALLALIAGLFLVAAPSLRRRARR